MKTPALFLALLFALLVAADGCKAAHRQPVELEKTQCAHVRYPAHGLYVVVVGEGGGNELEAGVLKAIELWNQRRDADIRWGGVRLELHVDEGDDRDFRSNPHIDEPALYIAVGSSSCTASDCAPQYRVLVSDCEARRQIYYLPHDLKKPRCDLMLEDIVGRAIGEASTL